MHTYPDCPVLEIATRTGFADGFTHINEGSARAEDLLISLCAELLADACNTGREPFVREDIPALKEIDWYGLIKIIFEMKR